MQWLRISTSYSVDWQQGQRPTANAGVLPANEGRTVHGQPPNAIQIQALGKLELLFYARWGHCRHPQQPHVPLAGMEPQLCSNKDKHTGRLGGGPPHDIPPFSFRLIPATTATATCTHPSNVAAAPAPCQVHLCNDNNVSDHAGGALPTSHLPRQSADGTSSHLPRRSASGTASPLPHSPCPARASAGNYDVPLQHNVPATSSFLTVRGG